MSENKPYLPAPGSLPDLILSLVALCGELPTPLISRLPGSERYKALAVNRLKEKSLIHTYYRNNLRGLRLTAAAKSTLIQLQPERYNDILSGNSVVSTPKYDIPSRLRLHRMAEVLVMMYRAGVVTLPWEKPGAFLPDEQFSSFTVTRPAYYSSHEVKRIGEQGNTIRNSRATGVLLAPDKLFAVFNTADGEMKWEYDTESRLKNFLKEDVCFTRLSDQYSYVTPEAFIVSHDINQFPGLFKETRGGKKPFVKGITFNHVHYLTMDQRGEVLLQILCSPGRRYLLDKSLTWDLAPARDYLVENDGFDENGAPVLLGYSCDVPRIHRFHEGLLTHNLTGTIFCFDFQKNALREVCGETVHIEDIDFDEYERSMFHIPP